MARLQASGPRLLCVMNVMCDEGRGSGNTTWFGGPPVYGWTIPMRDRATFWTSVRGNVRKGVGSVHS